MYRPDDQITQDYRKRLGETLDRRPPNTMLSAVALLCGLVALVFLLGYLLRKFLLRRRRNLNLKGKHSGNSYKASFYFLVSNSMDTFTKQIELASSGLL